MKKVVVIGSGLAGSLICNELAKDCSVTSIEAGQRSRIEYPHVGFLEKDFGVVKTFCIGGGGTTNLWHNGLMPLDPGRGTSVQKVRSNGWNADYAKVTQGPDSGIYTSLRQAEGRGD